MVLATVSVTLNTQMESRVDTRTHPAVYLAACRVIVLGKARNTMVLDNFTLSLYLCFTVASNYGVFL